MFKIGITLNYTKLYEYNGFHSSIEKSYDHCYVIHRKDAARTCSVKQNLKSFIGSLLCTSIEALNKIYELQLRVQLIPSTNVCSLCIYFLLDHFYALYRRNSTGTHRLNNLINIIDFFIVVVLIVVSVRHNSIFRYKFSFSSNSDVGRRSRQCGN